MTTLFRLLVAAVLVAPIAPTLHAQTIDTVPEPVTPAKVALVQELMVAGNFKRQLVRTMRETSARQSALPVPPGFWEMFLARAEQDIDTLLAPMQADYARYFTSAELRALIAFYQSPIGKRVSEVSPVLTANSSAVGQQWGMRVGQEVATELMNPTKPAPTSSAPGKPVKP
jgi:uncharacterized protein